MAEQDSSLPLFDQRLVHEEDETPTVRVAAPSAPRPIGPVVPPSAPAGSGRLVRHAWPLLSALARITGGATPTSVEDFKTSVTTVVRDFEQSALADGVNARDVSAARYVLCTALDEAVLTSRWGTLSGWNNASLLSVFHNETWGGEKVFTLIERAVQDRQQYADLLELCHMVMLLGFQGKFRLERDGSARVDTLRRNLYEVLRTRTAGIPPIPVPEPAPTAGRRRMVNYVPVWAVGAMCLLVVAIGFVWFDYLLTQEAGRVVREINSLSLGTPPGPSATSIQR